MTKNKMTNNENKKPHLSPADIGAQEAQWYFEQLTSQQRYSMFLHNDASNAPERKTCLSNTDFWFED